MSFEILLSLVTNEVMPKITVKNSQGAIVAEFQGNSEEALSTQIQDAGAPIPMSCGAGACRTCCCKVTKGMEHLEKEAVGPMHIMVDDDEILSCIASLKLDAPEEAEIEVSSENL